MAGYPDDIRVVPGTGPQDRKTSRRLRGALPGYVRTPPSRADLWGLGAQTEWRAIDSSDRHGCGTVQAYVPRTHALATSYAEMSEGSAKDGRDSATNLSDATAKDTFLCDWSTTAAPPPRRGNHEAC